MIQNLYLNPQNADLSGDCKCVPNTCYPHLDLFHFYGFLRFCNWILVAANITDEEMQEHYDNFYEDVYVECDEKYGAIEEMYVCDNVSEHLAGNVYIKVIWKHAPTPCLFAVENMSCPSFGTCSLIVSRMRNVLQTI